MILWSQLVKGVFGTYPSPSLVSLIKHLNRLHFPHLQNRNDTYLTGLLCTVNEVASTVRAQ